MRERIPAIRFGELIEEAAAELVDGPLGVIQQQLRELALRHRDPIKVWRVRWQMMQFGPDRLNRFANSSHLMAREIIHHLYISWIQR